MNYGAFMTKLANLHSWILLVVCGNFLVIAYRELRLLEIEILKILQGEQQVLNIDAEFNSQFYGIEIEGSL